jgi:hypothetical protein
LTACALRVGGSSVKDDGVAAQARSVRLVTARPPRDNHEPDAKVAETSAAINRLVRS